MPYDPTIAGVVFDFDGTLTQPGALDFPAMRKEIGCPHDGDILVHLRNLPASQQARAETIIQAMEMTAAERSVPNEGAETVIRELRKRGVKLAILTRNSRAAFDCALKRFSRISAADFAIILTRDEARRDKPHPDGVVQAAVEMGVPCDKIVVVGDFSYDIEAGQAAGAATAFLPPLPSATTRIAPTVRLTRLNQLLDVFF